MCLADKLSQRSEGVLIQRAGRDWIMPGSADFAMAVAESDARYLLLNDVTETCRDISGEWADLLNPSSPRLRVPMARVWVEWTDAASRQEIGLLVNAADDGRSGRIRVFWNTGEGPEVAQAEVIFDLDDPLVHGTQADGRHTFALGILPSRLSALAPHLALVFDPCWEEYFHGSALGAAALPNAARLCSERLLPDIIAAFAFFALLGVKVPLRERPIDRRKLNIARAKGGKPALLDHVELALGQPGGPAQTGADAGDGNRRNPRLHVVRGHLVRRRDSVFWRAAHMRGVDNFHQAMPRTRVVRMHSA